MESILVQTILELNADDARNFFMQQERYCSISLPKYFDFQNLLNKLSISVKDKRYKYTENIGKKFEYRSDIWETEPKKFADVNYMFFQNKDGRFSWRPLQIINPVLYVYLVQEITKEENWKLIVERFEEFSKNDKIKCYSIPLVNHTPHQSDTAHTILNWWDKMEQQSIELAMEYNYLMVTDITDCYGSIYTHSITWAMCGQENAKKKINKEGIDKRSNELYQIGDLIDKIVEAMSHQQTNGIPQGSVLMDFIAELVLGYADLELSEELSKSDIKDYQILRYRDDYKIFGNTQEDVIKIAKMLTEVLAGLNFRLNTQKTVITQDIINGSIKPDKLYYITHGLRELEEPDANYTLEKHLLRINKLAQEHPNSGSVQKSMDFFYKRICKSDNLDMFRENAVDVWISILTNIAFNNPKVYRQYVGIVSKILSQEKDANKKNEVITKILKKFKQLPNVGYLEVWLQRLTIKDDRNRNDFSEKICKYAATKENSIWNISWLKKDIQKLFEDNPIVVDENIGKMSDTIEYEEAGGWGKYS